MFPSICGVPLCSLNYFLHFAKVHICQTDSLSGVFSGPQNEGGLSNHPRRLLLAHVEVRLHLRQAQFSDILILEEKKRQQRQSDCIKTTIVMRDRLSGLCLTLAKKPHGFQ